MTPLNLDRSTAARSTLVHSRSKIAETNVVDDASVGNENTLVPGRSGCKLRLFQTSGKTLIRKTSKSDDYSARLVKQANKQQAFNRFVTCGSFRVPAITSIFPGDTDNPAFVDMEFVHAEKYSDYLGRVSSARLARFSEAIINYLDQLVSYARPIRIRNEILIRKLDAVTAAIDPTRTDCQIIKDCYESLRFPPDEMILLGRCHGDFTLSNMLFQCDRVYLIDFLDSFLETPCQDVVKLRQDTAFHWSLALEPMLPQHQRNRVLQTLQYVDARISQWMIRHPLIRVWYDYLQTFNLYRILPYVSAEHEINFVQQALTQHLKHATDHTNGGAIESISRRQTKVDADTPLRQIHGNSGNLGFEPARF